MAMYSIRKFAPIAGKSALLAERARSLAGIYAQNGARARVARVIAGDDAGQIYVIVSVDDSKTMMHIWEKTQTHPAFQKLLEDHEIEPAGSGSGPDVYRTVHGQVQPGYPVILMREYTISRDRLDDALGLMPELDALVQRHAGHLLAAVPVFSGDMGRLIVGYYHKSAAHLGDNIDGVGTSAEFRAIVAKAASFGSLTRSRVLHNV